MSVTLAELDPVTRQRVLEQIPDAAESTSMAVVEPKQYPSYSEAENLARRVLARMDSLAAKLRNLEADIRQLWVEFDKLQDGETILGCATKKEFCEKKLHRTPRAVQYMLAGGNPDNAKPSEIISPSPSAAEIEVPAPAEPEPESQPSPKPEPTLENVLNKLVERIALQPYGYYAAKFKTYPEQHTTDLAIIEGTRLDIWQRIVEIGQAKLRAHKEATSVLTSLENIGQ